MCASDAGGCGDARGRGGVAGGVFEREEIGGIWRGDVACGAEEGSLISISVRGNCRGVGVALRVSSS